MPPPLYRQTFDAAALLRDHPPKFRHARKAKLFDLAYPSGTAPPARVEVTRWPQHLPLRCPLSTALPTAVLPDYYDYRIVDAAAFEWHVNFADRRLFYAYGGCLFAQDEMQVAEHPLFASVREALLDMDLPAETADRHEATPILITNVERRLAVATDVNAAEGRPIGLYGNHFVRAPWDAVLKATRVIAPPTVTNLIAMVAPSGGYGDYKTDDIEQVFATAHTGFAAAVAESAGRITIVHTGFWGCGAFGGNRRLMTALQSLAARAAGVGRLVFHAGDAAGVDDAAHGLDVADTLASYLGPSCTPSALAEQTAKLGYRWGVSDGN